MQRYRSHSDGSVGDWLVGAAKRNPEAFLVLAAGCALFLRGSGNGRSSSTRYSAGQEFSAGGDFQSDEFGEYDAQQSSRRTRAGKRGGMRERVSGIAETAGEYASEVTDRLYDTAASYASTASDYAGQGRRIVTRQASRLGGRAHHMADRVLQDQPLAVVVLGLAAGAGVAALLPATELEERTFAPAREALGDAASRTAENLKDAAGEMGKQLKTSVSERVVREAAQAFTKSFSGGDERNATGSDGGTRI